MSKKCRILFWAFAILSFSRSAVLILNFSGIVQWQWLTLWHVMLAPQSVVFADPLFYTPAHYCILYDHREPKCLTSPEYVRDDVTEPYIIAGGPIMHATIGFLRFPNQAFGEHGGEFLKHYLCRDEATEYLISQMPIQSLKSNPERGVYAVSCKRD